jgi:hypothetical protein
LNKILKIAFFLISFSGFSQYKELPEGMCNVFGKIYYTYSETDADYKVYFEKIDVLSDFIIYKEENELFATSSGVWHEVYDLRYADFKIFGFCN